MNASVREIPPGGRLGSSAALFSSPIFLPLSLPTRRMPNYPFQGAVEFGSP